MKHKPHFTPEQVDEIWNLYVTERMPILFNKTSFDFDINKEAICLICQQLMFKDQYHLQATDRKQAWHLHHYDLNQANDLASNLDPMHLHCSPKEVCLPIYAKSDLV